jgi:hypothetical protein
VVFKTIEIVAEAEEREHFRIGLIHETEEDPNRSLLL